MASEDDRAAGAMEANPVQPTGLADMDVDLDADLIIVPEVLGVPDPTGDPADTDDEKAHRDAFLLIMQGFHAATRTLSGSYQDACQDIHNIVRRALQKTKAIDHNFIWGASGAIQWLVKAVQPAMDCMGESLDEQAGLLQEAQQASKEATEDILALLPAEQSPYLTPAVPKEDLLSPALEATHNHMERAIEAVNAELLVLVHQHVPPEQAGVFLASLLQVLCSYQQEMAGMATSQVVIPSQIVPNLWGISRSMMEGLTLLGPPSCPASWSSSLVEQIMVDPTKKAASAELTTPVKRNNSVLGKGKSHPGSSGKKSGPKQITEYWDDDERKKEDEESWQQEEEKHHKKSSGPVLSLNKHKEPITILTSKAAPGQVSQVSGPSSHAPSKSKRSHSKVRQASPVRVNSSEDEPLSDKAGEPEPKSRRRDNANLELMIIDDGDDDPLPGRPKGTGKKGKSCTYSQEELAGLKSLLLWLKSEAWSIQYSMETAGLTKYRNSHVLGLWGAPNTDDHSAYLTKVKKESWSYPAKGNLCTVHQFITELRSCPDPEKRKLANKTLREKGMPGIPQENTLEAGKQELIKARYIIMVLQSVEGETIDSKHPDYGRDQNIGLHDIVSLASMKKMERSSQMTVRGQAIKGNVDYGYCPLCPYASQNHRTLNNHVRMHFRPPWCAACQTVGL